MGAVAVAAQVVGGGAIAEIIDDSPLCTAIVGFIREAEHLEHRIGKLLGIHHPAALGVKLEQAPLVGETLLAASHTLLRIAEVVVVKHLARSHNHLIVNPFDSNTTPLCIRNHQVMRGPYVRMHIVL